MVGLVCMEVPKSLLCMFMLMYSSRVVQEVMNHHFNCECKGAGGGRRDVLVCFSGPKYAAVWLTLVRMSCAGGDELSVRLRAEGAGARPGQVCAVLPGAPGQGRRPGT